MYELRIAFKYLVPRMRQLSVSLISLISILVIGLVVWLMVVFFSTTEGLAARWTDKLIAITSTLRVLPNDGYYRTYYYQIDTAAGSSGYHIKSLAEKVSSPVSDPYNPAVDAALPTYFPHPILHNGHLLDLAKEADDAIRSIPGLTVSTFETTFANIRLRLVREASGSLTQEQVTQASYITSLDPHNPRLSDALLPLKPEDLQNVLQTIETVAPPLDVQRACLTAFFDRIAITGLAGFHNVRVTPILTPTPYLRVTATLDGKEMEIDSPIGLEGYAIDAFELKTPPPGAPQPPWLGRDGGLWHLPVSLWFGDGILLPRSYREVGVRVGDRGTLNYTSPNLTRVAEQRADIIVAGFYDPGIIPLGGKLLLASPELVGQINSSIGPDSALPTGFAVDCPPKDARAVKEQLVQALRERGVGAFFDVETYDEYPYSKDIFQQLKSERNLFSLISVIIVVVACSNIVSMLVLLVQQKSKEIAILRALGATKWSVALIFGICGIVIGCVGTLVGTVAAYYTLQHLPSLLAFLGRLQGFEVLNAAFYGDVIPTTMSRSSVEFVVVTTACVALLAGIIPAIKAARQPTAEALRAE